MVDAIPNVDGSALFTDEEQAVVLASTELTKTARLSEAMFNRVTDAFQTDVERAEDL